jgi:selenocysteine-specific elongation factor
LLRALVIAAQNDVTAMYTIGTAGHVDHGKSALVQALTGIDPDRLREEKERGLTIDLGFAWFTLPGGEEVSIVDVPGHERFIKNMLAGVGGIDLALLVIAADEGVMPQTREHLAIIDLLGIEHGVVAVTKADLVEEDFLDLVKAEAGEAVTGTSIELAPVVACSAVTRHGLEELTATLEAELAKTPARRDNGRPRLPIDRAFTMAGFGTVVTGTLIDGSLRLGDDVEIVPGRLKSRTRGLQTHGRKVEVALPGRRTAANLSGIAFDQLERGMVVARPGSLKAVMTVDVRLRAVRYAGRAVRHNLSVTFHTGPAEVEGRLLLLDRDELPPGESGWAQIRLSKPIAALKGDRFVIRDPNDTLGGGWIVDTDVKRHRRHHAETIAALESFARGSPEDVVLAALRRLEPAEAQKVINESGLDAGTAREALDALIASDDIVSLPGAGLTGVPLLYSAEGLMVMTVRLREILGGYHQMWALRPGMPKEELRSRLGLTPRVLEQLLSYWAGARLVREVGTAIAIVEHEPRVDPGAEERVRCFLEKLRASPFSPPADVTLDEDLLAYLEDRREIVRVGEGVAFAAEAYGEAVDRVIDHIREQGSVTLAEVRDMLTTSRKYAQALLEHMDAEHITRRVGDARVLRRG